MICKGSTFSTLFSSFSQLTKWLTRTSMFLQGSENNLEELFLSFHHVALGWHSGPQAWQEAATFAELSWNLSPSLPLYLPPSPFLLSSLCFLLAKPDQSHRVNILSRLPSLGSRAGSQGNSISLGQKKSPTQSSQPTARLQSSLGMS